VQFDLLNRKAYNNFGGSTVWVDNFNNIQVFRAGNGTNTFFGGAGNNALIGGSGIDTLDYSALGGAETINFATGIVSKSIGGTDSFSGFEIFKGGAGNDTFAGGSGNHVIDGGAGSNTLDYSATTGPVQFDLVNSKTYSNFAGASTVGVDSFSNIQAFKGSAGNDTFVGGSGNHTPALPDCVRSGLLLDS
jgi:Ca2+-binding RTX toxin-like protein